jgi:general stress protein YciG
MAGTTMGAAKAKKTNLERHGKNFFATIGKVGGSATGVKKGFAADPERARRAGKLGGARSRRTKANSAA